MTIYVFDSGPLIDLFRHYYPERFPSLWKRFFELVDEGQITSTREVSNELLRYEDDLATWCKQAKQIFPAPTSEELAFVRQIFEVPHFQGLITKKHLLSGLYVADPFIIARAKCLQDGCVVTTEIYKRNASKIPNVCKNFEVDCVGLEAFMEREGWVF